MRIFVLVLSGLIGLALGVLAWGWGSLTDFLGSPAMPAGEAVVVVVPENVGLAGAVALLQEKGLVPHSRWLDVYVDHLHAPTDLKPGEYRVSPAMTPVQQIELIESGNVVTYPISVEPGMTAREVVSQLAAEGLGDEAELLGLIEDRTFARSLGIDGPSLEGFLYPDIYDLPRGLRARKLLKRLVDRFRAATASLNLGEGELSEYQLVTMASLIERSEVKGKERRLYAALLRDRLALRIALSHKGANAYGELRLPEDATADERRTHDWNTTHQGGLPATPIASPSLESLTAAASPTQSQVLYMVERGNGTHVFCPDLECYLEAFRKHKGRSPRGLPRKF